MICSRGNYVQGYTFHLYKSIHSMEGEGNSEMLHFFRIEIPRECVNNSQPIKKMIKQISFPIKYILLFYTYLLSSMI